MSHRLICEGVTHFIEAANIMCFSETDAATGFHRKSLCSFCSAVPVYQNGTNRGNSWSEQNDNDYSPTFVLFQNVKMCCN